MTFEHIRRNFLKGAAAITGSLFLPKRKTWAAENWYAQGGVGYYEDEAEAERYNESIEFDNYGDVCDHFGSWKPYEAGLYLPFLAVLKAEAIERSISGSWAELTERLNIYPESQTTGDCVSHFCRNLSDLVRASDVYGLEQDEAWRTRTATEPIYGHRGHPGAGANCERLMAFLTNDGGMMLRKRYEIEGFGTLDLSKYNARIGMDWGRSGVPRAVREVAKNHQIIRSTRIDDREQFRAAWRNGLAVGGCSMIAFDRRRNEDGVSEVRGSWAHAMQAIGFDERADTIKKYGCPLVLEQNSWGAWNSGPRKIRGTNLLIPKGSCWVKEDDYIRKKVVPGSCFTAVGARGWGVERLTDFGLSAFG